jgi:hypothetical protein
MEATVASDNVPPSVLQHPADLQSWQCRGLETGFLEKDEEQCYCDFGLFFVHYSPVVRWNSAWKKALLTINGLADRKPNWPFHFVRHGTVPYTWLELVVIKRTRVDHEGLSIVVYSPLNRVSTSRVKVDANVYTFPAVQLISRSGLLSPMLSCLRRSL